MAIAASYVSKVQLNLAGGGYQTLNGINDISFGLNKTLVDISAMNGADDHTARLAALKDFPITVSGFFDPADAAYVYAQTQFVSGGSMLVDIYYTNSTGFRVTAIVESIDFSASVDGAMEVSITMQSNSDVATF
jgi:predicted secreted protein